MRSQLFALAALATLAVGLSGCSKNGKSKGMVDNGQLMGASYGNIRSMGKPYGMVYVPPGTFHMGPSDEDVNFNFTARNKQVSINGFWMDATEITNNEYRQFVWWVRDSLAAKELQFGKETDGGFAVDWKKAQTIKYSDKSVLEKISKLTLTPDNRLYGRNEIDPEKLLFRVESFNLKEAAKLENKGKPRSSFVIKYDEKIYPDTLVWMRDFS